VFSSVCVSDTAYKLNRDIQELSDESKHEVTRYRIHSPVQVCVLQLKLHMCVCPVQVCVIFYLFIYKGPCKSSKIIVSMSCFCTGFKTHFHPQSPGRSTLTYNYTHNTTHTHTHTHTLHERLYSKYELFSRSVCTHGL